MKIGDLVKHETWGLGLVTVEHWDEIDCVSVFRVEFIEGGWSLERETDLKLEVINENR